MARKQSMTNDEIEAYMKSKQVSSDQYVAPTQQSTQQSAQQTVQQPTQKKKSTGISDIAQTITQATTPISKIALFNNANQAIDNKKVNDLNQKQKLFGLFKTGDKNLASGMLNSSIDFASDIAKGYHQTLEGLADTLQYGTADTAKMWSDVGRKVLGENNALSNAAQSYSDFWKNNAKKNSTQAMLGLNENPEDNLALSDIYGVQAQVYKDVLGENNPLTRAYSDVENRMKEAGLGLGWRQRVDEKSYLGDMSDSIGEGIGNIGAMAALSAVGGAGMGAAGVGTTASGALTTGGKLALSGGNSFMTAYGNSRSEAYNNGASDKDSRIYGFVNGLAEAASEQFFDAMPGIKSAGIAEKLGIKDFLSNKLKSKMGSGAAKVFLKVVGGLEEGGEEMISNALTTMGSDLIHMLDQSYTYGMDEEKIKNLDSGNILERRDKIIKDGFDKLFSEDSWKSFFSAGITSLLLGGGGEMLSTHQQNQIINEYAKENNMTVKEARNELFSKENIAKAEEMLKQNNVEAENDIELEDAAKKSILNNPQVFTNQQAITQPETPQIETKPQDNINTQQITQNVVNDIKQANNEVVENKPLAQTRTAEDFKNPNTNAYQYDNPQVRPYFKDAAYDLKQALDNYTFKGERYMREDGSWGGNKFSSTPEIAELHNDYNMKYDQIEKGINGIIKDNGQENNAASKKVEVVIDKMLRNGYRSEFDELTNKPNQDYIDTVNGKQVENKANEQVDEDLPFFESNEEMPTTEKESTQNDNIAERKSDDVLTVELTGEKGQKYFEDHGVDEKVAKILSENPKEQKEKLSDTLKDVAGETYRLMVSNAGEIEKIAKLTKKPTVKYKYDRSMRARSEAQQHIGEAQADLNGKKYTNFTNQDGKQVNMSLNDIRQDAKKNGISEQTLNEYLAHWLNVDRYAEGKPVFGASVNSNMSMEEIAKLDKEHPELHRIAKNVWTYEHNELKNLYDSGLITEKMYNNLAQNEHYVRIQRHIENAKGSNRTVIDRNGRVSIDNTIQEAKGGNQDIKPIMEGIAKYTETMLEAERKNQAVAELAKAMGVGSQNDSLDYNEESFGINPEFVKSNDDGTYTMTYFNKGVATEIPINKAIYDAFVKNKAISAMENNKTFKAITYTPKKLSTMFRGLTTNYNPMFMITNAFKDIGDAPFNSKYTKEFVKTYASTEALRQVAGNGVYNQLYRQLGGQDDSYFTEGEFVDKKSKIENNKALKVATTPGRVVKNAVLKGNEIVESVPRVAEFIATIKANGYEVNQDGELVLKDSQKAKGKTAGEVIDEALYNAAEVTTNFKRGGDLAKSINRNGGTFFNASIQGFDKQIRNFKDAFTSGDKKMIVALLLKAIVFGIAPTMINDGMYDDDDEYKELQDYIKDNYYIFKSGDGTWIRIPKGRAMSVIGSAYRRGKDYLGGDKDAFKGFAEFASGQVAPNNPFESNIISPFFAVANNKSWSGNKIISQSLEKRPTNEQYNEKTDVLSKWLGEQLKNAPVPDNFKSPMGINYLIDQYTGGAGDVFLPWLTPKATGKTENPLVQPFVSKFTADADYSNKSVGTFYDTMTELEKKKNSVNANEIDKLKYSYIYSQNQKMAALKKEQSAIQSDTSLSNEEKYEQAKEKQKEINELAKKSVKDLDNIENNKYYAIVGDNTYYLNKDGTFSKDAYADSHKKSADKKGMALYDYYKEKYEKSIAKEDK